MCWQPTLLHDWSVGVINQNRPLRRTSVTPRPESLGLEAIRGLSQLTIMEWQIGAIDSCLCLWHQVRTHSQ